MGAPLTPDDRRRRELMRFCRWLGAVLAADQATGHSIFSMVREIDRNGMAESEKAAALDALDDILCECLGHRADD